MSSELQIIENNLVNHNFQVATDILFRQVDSEAVLLHVPSGTYYSLSATSMLFWEAIQNQCPLDAVVEEILAEYDVERSQVLSELQVFLQNLLDNELIVPSAA